MKHEFALFSPDPINYNSNNQLYSLTNKDLIHRISTILRLSVHDIFVIFDRSHYYTCNITDITKKNITVKIISNNIIIALKPEIHWLLPLLERDFFNEAIYSLTAMGATSITPIITQKSRQKWGTESDYDRVTRIAVSAAEQSKNFFIPDIKKPVHFEKAVENSAGSKILFDVNGINAYKLCSDLYHQQPKIITCCVGPEGDLHDEEKQYAYHNKFIGCTLTPTVLRASQAITVGMGLIRSILAQK